MTGTHEALGTVPSDGSARAPSCLRAQEASPHAGRTPYGRGQGANSAQQEYRVSQPLEAITLEVIAIAWST